MFKRQTLAHAFHCRGTLDLGGHGVDFRRHPEVVDGLILLPDGVLRVDARPLRVALLQGLLHFRLLLVLLLLRLLGQAFQLLGAELQLEHRV